VATLLMALKVVNTFMNFYYGYVVVQGKIPLGKHWHRWDKNAETNLGRDRTRRSGLDSTGSRLRLVTRCCEDGNEPSDSKKYGQFID
jgi:hypothetical protein